MTLIEEFMAEITTSVTGSTKVNYEDTVLDFTPPYPRRTYREVIQEYAHIDINDYPDRNSLAHSRDSRSQNCPNGAVEIMDELFKSCRKHLVQPTFIKSPHWTFALNQETKLPLVEISAYREIMEIVNTFSELNDP